MAHPESRTIEHMAVILARGQSSRLGSPKGMAKVPGSHQTLLSAVDELYQKRGWPRIVVTLPELLPSYQGLLDHDPTRQWVTFGPGGDTARTLRVAWEHMQKKSGFGDWMWAHPVDVPLVQTKTLDKIQSTLDPGGQQVYRPVHQGQPGHPVVLSHHFLDSVFSSKLGEEDSGPMRHLLNGEDIGQILVEDRGVVQDFDTPEDFQKE